MGSRQFLIAVDQLANTLIGGMADETISARAHRRQWRKTEAFINWLFRNDLHCAQAYVSEMAGSQNAREYRK